MSVWASPKRDAVKAITSKHQACEEHSSNGLGALTAGHRHSSLKPPKPKPNRKESIRSLGEISSPQPHLIKDDALKETVCLGRSHCER